jgi:U-box domain
VQQGPWEQQQRGIWGGTSLGSSTAPADSENVRKMAAAYGLLCPITREVMREPVVAADGYTYEKRAIQVPACAERPQQMPSLECGLCAWLEIGIKRFYSAYQIGPRALGAWGTRKHRGQSGSADAGHKENARRARRTACRALLSMTLQ